MSIRQAEPDTARILKRTAIADEDRDESADRGRPAAVHVDDGERLVPVYRKSTADNRLERSTRVLVRLLSWTPFLDLHQRAPYPESHHVRAELCFALDLLVRAVVIGTAFFVLMAIAWKAVAPLPHLWP